MYDVYKYIYTNTYTLLQKMLQAAARRGVVVLRAQISFNFNFAHSTIIIRDKGETFNLSHMIHVYIYAYMCVYMDKLNLPCILY